MGNHIVLDANVRRLMRLRHAASSSARACYHQFSVTSGTVFASRKLSFGDILYAIAIFTNGAKGISALQLSRDVDVNPKTAFVLATNSGNPSLRYMSAQNLSGEVEIDGAYFGGYVKPSRGRQTAATAASL